MRSCVTADLAITGVGVVSPFGQGAEALSAGLLRGAHAFGVMRREGRQRGTEFLGAEVPPLSLPPELATRRLHTASLSTQTALLAVHEAWLDANLAAAQPARVGLIVGGSNFQQRELTLLHDAHAGRLGYLRPSYGMSFLDTDLCGMCTEQFGIRGLAHTVGGASASGQLAVIQAAQAVLAGDIDIGIAVGALMDVSYWECQALRSMGAMGSDRHASRPAEACRPFDRQRDGFIYGENCGAVVIEKLSRAARENVRPYAHLAGWSVAIDAHRDPDPSCSGEMQAIRGALEHARLSPEAIDYVNPHGSGSVIGDETELEAVRGCGLSHAWINATKSILGHGLSAAGAVEIIATLLQMKAGTLHPTRNLHEPIDPGLRWVLGDPVHHAIERALCISIGFGGINTAVCLERPRARREGNGT